MIDPTWPARGVGVAFMETAQSPRFTCDYPELLPVVTPRWLVTLAFNSVQ